MSYSFISPTERPNSQNMWSLTVDECMHDLLNYISCQISKINNGNFNNRMCSKNVNDRVFDRHPKLCFSVLSKCRNQQEVIQIRCKCNPSQSHIISHPSCKSHIPSHSSSWCSHFDSPLFAGCILWIISQACTLCRLEPNRGTGDLAVIYNKIHNSNKYGKHGTYNYSYWGFCEPTYNWVASHCSLWLQYDPL